MDTQLFVQNVKYYCEKRGVKPTVACKESGAGKDLINQIERRRSMPSVEKVQMLAEYLGVTTSELLGEAPKPGRILWDTTITHTMPEILAELEKLSPQSCEEVFAFILFKQEQERVN